MCQVCDLPLCRILLCDDASYPCWLVLVPRVNHVRELTDLAPAQQAQLWREVAAACAAVQRLYRPHKLNVATLGNVVPQLHVHVTGRLQSDPAWPGPCYGAAPAQPLGTAQLLAAVELVRGALGEASL